ncbi:DUF805 domain-containing protein [Kitasatospora sp. NPDC048365]|uniref:DUF805 domain-containing protein n=1 Tax=Kitasatospora sp. NPDC048365 TaxID=3364050 RepID=UPI00371E7284
MEWYLAVLKNYAGFEGRAHRREFWMFTLVSVVISIVLTIIDRILGIRVIDNLYTLAVLLPSLAVGARRLHDTGRSGWWQLLSITVIGIVPLIWFWAQEGSTEANKYGTVPAPAAA